MRVLLVLGAMLLSSLVTLWVAPLIQGAATADTRLPAEHDQSTGTDAAGAAPSQAAATTSRQSCLSEAEMRKIVREELAGLVAGLAQTDAAAKSQLATPRSETDNKRQLEFVNQLLDRHIREGAISDSDMANLQIEIGKLDKASRSEMLSKLVGAINSGSLHGRL